MPVVTIGGFTADLLTAQPFGYEGDARAGLTARTFQIAGLLTPAEWVALVGAYNAWRDLRITDPDTFKAAAIGTTVNLTISGANGLAVTALPCWFASAPAGEQAGRYIQASATLVDAAQALAVLLREREKALDRDLPAGLGTVTLGSATVTLTAPMLTRRDGPQVAMTAGGTSHVTGPLVAHQFRQIQGFISSGTPDDVLSWYDSTIASIPAANSWFPVSEPSFTAEPIVSGGVKLTRYSVSLSAVRII